MLRSTMWGMAAAAALLVGSAGTFGRAVYADGETGTLTVIHDDPYCSHFPEGVGGEFQIATLSDPSGALVLQGAAFRAGGSYFQTFCGQLQEDISFNYPYAWTVSSYFNGDASTPLLKETAYLFKRFFDGSLPGYDYTPGPGRSESARSVQLAIWQIQGQILPGSTFATYYAGDTDAQAYVALAQANATSIGNVRVLTMLDGTHPVQDILCILTGGTPGLLLEKTVDPTNPVPFEPVTYSYLLTNTGTVPLTGIVVHDDNGTPADPSDDYDLGPISLLPGESNAGALLTKTLIPPVKMCAPLDGVPTEVGKLYVTLGADRVCARYVQSRALNDNTYGSEAAEANWGSHSFGNLTGSDKCEFIFKSGNGTTVFRAFEDYITASAGAPSGFKTLGVTGGEGGVSVGSAANVKSYDTSISRALNLPQFATPLGAFTTNSPEETVDYPNYSGISVPPGWIYENWYELCIDKALFTAGNGGFGSVEIGIVHNSPAKTGSNAVYPKPCDDCITNTATATATWSGGTITSNKATAKVCIDAGTSGSAFNVVWGKITVKDKYIQVELTNNGSGAVTLSGATLTWPIANVKLTKAKLGTKTLWDAGTWTTPSVITFNKGTTSDRSINPGAKKTLKFEFSTNVDTTLASYDLTINFVGGATLTPF